MMAVNHSTHRFITAAMQPEFSRLDTLFDPLIQDRNVLIQISEESIF